MHSPLRAMRPTLDFHFMIFFSHLQHLSSDNIIVQRFGISVLTKHVGTTDLVMLLFYMHNVPYPFGNAFRTVLCVMRGVSDRESS